MGTLYIDTGGLSTNSGCTDTALPLLTGLAATVAGSVITLDGLPDLSGLITSGATQSSIFLAQATNTNTKIFWITAVDNGLKQVTVSVAPTGVTASSWSIGGQFYLGDTGSPQNNKIEAALRAGDTAIFNNSPNPRSGSGPTWQFRNVGTSASGFATIKGKAGVRPILTNTGNQACVSQTSLCWVENLELHQIGTGVGITTGTSCVVYNVIVRGNTSTVALNSSGASTRIINCSVFGGTVGIQFGASRDVALGCYINGATSDGIKLTSSTPANGAILNTIITNCGGAGINFSGAVSAQTHGILVANNTIWNNAGGGILVGDVDWTTVIFNNTVSENGVANINWTAGSAELVSIHGYNTVYGANVPIGFTLNSQISGTEFSTDPLFVDAGGGDFEIRSGSPALNSGFPGVFLGGLSTGSPSQGAAAPPVSGSSAVTIDTAFSIRI